MKTKVYRPSAKAMRRTWLTSDYRLILLPGTGLAVVFNIDNVVHSFTPYKAKDSHLNLSHEDVPARLTMSKEQFSFMLENDIELPVKEIGIVVREDEVQLLAAMLASEGEEVKIETT